MKSKKMRKSLILIVFMGAFPIIQSSTDEFINAYEYWAQFKPGTYVSFKFISQIREESKETWKTFILKHVTPEKVIIEEKTAGLITLLTFHAEDPPWAADDLFDGALNVNLFNPSLTSGSTETTKSIEYIEIKGAKIKAERMKIQFDEDKTRITINVWFSKDIPGKVARFTREIAGVVSVKEEIVAADFKAIKTDASEYHRLLYGSKKTIPASIFLWRNLRFFNESRRVEDDWSAISGFYGRRGEWIEKLEVLVQDAETWESHFHEDIKKIEGQLKKKNMEKLEPFMEHAGAYCTVFVHLLKKLYGLISSLTYFPETITPDIIYEFEELKELIDQWKSALSQYASEKSKLKDIKITYENIISSF